MFLQILASASLIQSDVLGSGSVLDAPAYLVGGSEERMDLTRPTRSLSRNLRASLETSSKEALHLRYLVVDSPSATVRMLVGIDVVTALRKIYSETGKRFTSSGPSIL
jgi:hypothetical protein